MTFRIDDKRLFTRKITLPDGGDFRATFRILTDAAIEAHALGDVEGEKEFLREVITDLADVDGPNGPLPFGLDLVDQMLGFSDIRLGFLKAYREGRSDIQTGN